MRKITIVTPLNVEALLNDRDLPDGITIASAGRLVPLSLDPSIAAIVVVTWVSGVSTRLLVRVIFEIIKKHCAGVQPRQITINRQVIEFSQGEIVRVIEEHIEQKDV